tara:strand:- start:1455 stop:2408 length:954 start_codon:yes stop_codon:yes gene_type:complete
MTIQNENFFKIIRAGINTTFQDLGRKNLYHIGIPFSGAMDNRNYLISNKLVNNNLDSPVLEFAYQGPLLKYYGDKIVISITGDVNFEIKKSSKTFIGNCYESYIIEDQDEINILSTKKSVYGYFSVGAQFDLEFYWGSCSTNTKAKIGSNDGNKLIDGQKIKLKKTNDDLSKKNLDYINSSIEKIRVLKGTNYDYFSEKGKKSFFEKEFLVSKLTDRMGMRLEGATIENIFDTNIKSEGLVKGVIQITSDGNPIIMLSDHGTIGGYPKIGVVISADYDKLVQLFPGSKIKFQEIELSDAETLFKMYEMETQKLISQI